MNAVRDDNGASATHWLLNFTSSNSRATDGDGRPWGDGTAIAQRAYIDQRPWDDGCEVASLIGGFEAMNAIRDAFESAIFDADAQALRGVPPGQRGHVYIADWLLNALRDLSVDNPWRGGPWNPKTPADPDQTALGLVVRMMSAGIVVRLMLWMPTTVQSTGGLSAHADEHWRLAAAIQDHNNTLVQTWRPAYGLVGVVALDLRTAAQDTASLHQKMIVVRVGKVNEAFCGGVDLAFTRRDFGLTRQTGTGEGDWQSGATTPAAKDGWPKQRVPPLGGYPTYPYDGQGDAFPEDLCADVYADPDHNGYRHWYDQHLRLRGPIVATLEQQFAERWIMDTGGRVYLFDRSAREIGTYNQVQATTNAVIRDKSLVPLPIPAPVDAAGAATVQMWRTIPLRPKVAKGPFKRGEFTVMAGVANAVSRATELITIWDQYFWSVPLAKLLAARLRAEKELLLLIVLPPFGTSLDAVSDELAFRYDAMQALWNGLDADGRSRVLACDMWSPGPNCGVYVHAKVQTYDLALLVCGSANMNRRSFECDAELDCAVLHAPTVRQHLAGLHAHVTGGEAWSSFEGDWLRGWWESIRDHGQLALIEDPFFAANVPDRPKTPNGVDMPHAHSWKPRYLFEPSSIDGDIDADGAKCPYDKICADTQARGRLDGVSCLLERCHSGNTWPWRVAADPWTAGTEGERAPATLPRLTL